MTMTQYPYILATNHIVAEIAGLKVLIDTGSPETLGIVPKLTLSSWSFPVNQNVPSVLVDQLEQEVGTHVDVLLGCDIMENFDITIDPENATVTFRTEALPTPAAGVPVRFDARLPIIPVKVAGVACQAVFDTGAHVSYASRVILSKARPVETTSDFHISLGKFTTPIYKEPLSVGREVMFLRFGVLPEGCALLGFLVCCDVDAIIGSELLNTHAVAFSLRHGWLELTRRATGPGRQQKKQ